MRGANWLVMVVLVPACFRPSFDHVQCSPQGECPSGLTCSALDTCELASTPAADASAASVIDAATSEMGVDAATDAPASTQTCWQRWLDHSVALQTPAPIRELMTSGTERDPWISDDGLRLYFWRMGVTGTADAYLAARATSSDTFSTAAKLESLSLADRDESRVSLTRDELVLAVSSNLGASSQFDIRIATRTSRGQPFVAPTVDLLSSVNTASTQHFDPFLSGDGLRLYLAPVPAGGTQHIALASRASLTSDFTAAAQMAAINTTEAGAGDADPALSGDERVIVFSSNRSGGRGSSDLYYATRASAAAPFGAPVPIPTVNGGSDDDDPILTSDGCTLYFATLRAGNFDLYTAAVTP